MAETMEDQNQHVSENQQTLMKKNRISEDQNGSGKKIDIFERRNEKSRESGLKSHAWIEKERRKKMRNLYDNLRALIPNLPSTAGKLTILDEAMNYIKSLEHIVEKLEQLKKERLKSASTFGFVNNSKEKLVKDCGFTSNLACGMGTSNPSNSNPASVSQLPASFQTWYSPNVVLNICGLEAKFSVFTLRKANLLTIIAFVLHKYNIEVITANICCNDDGYFGCMILAKANLVSSHQFTEKIYVDEIYKQAVEEIKLLIS